MSEICRSSSARSTSVKHSRSAYFAGRSKGTSTSLDQMPCRSGSPHGVFGAGPVLATMGALLVVAEVRPEKAYITSDTIAMVVASPASRSNRAFSLMDMIGWGMLRLGLPEPVHLTADQPEKPPYLRDKSSTAMPARGARTSRLR